MGLYTDLTLFFSENAGPGIPPPAAQIIRANKLVNEIIGPWVASCAIPAGGAPLSTKPVSFNPAGLPMVISGFCSPPVPTPPPTPGSMLIDQGINMLMTAMPFVPGTPVMPGMVSNVLIGPSMPPTAMFMSPTAPGMMPPVLAQLWATALQAAAMSVMVPYTDMAPGSPPVPAPGVAPLAVPPDTMT